MISIYFQPRVIASHPRIAAFISIPRNASRTVVQALGIGPNRNTENTNSPVIHENHQRGCVLQEKYDLEGLFTFCVVRNPFERCMSWYHGHRIMEPYREPYRSLSFDDWVRRGLPHHWGQQNETNYARLGISPLLQSTFTESCRLDYICKMENFDRDFAQLTKLLNALSVRARIERRFSVSRTRVGESGRETNLDFRYTRETRRLVFLLLEKDFEAFGYTSGLTLSLKRKQAKNSPNDKSGDQSSLKELG